MTRRGFLRRAGAALAGLMAGGLGLLRPRKKTLHVRFTHHRRLFKYVAGMTEDGRLVVDVEGHGQIMGPATREVKEGEPSPWIKLPSRDCERQNT